MTFDEWWGDGHPYEDCKNVAKMAYDSRDAEVANLAALGSIYLSRANAAEQECEALRQQLDWVRNILASHGYDGPLGDGCCPLSEWLSERDDLGEGLAQVKVKNQVLIQQLASNDAKVAKMQRIIESRQAELASVMRANSNKFDTIQKLNAQIKTARGYLERLACLGNGDQHGNSNGNCLAIEGLAAMEPK